MRLAELLRLNLEDIHRKTRKAGWNAREVHTRMFCSLWGHLRAVELTRKMIQDWAADRKRIRADATVKFELSLLRRAYNLGIELELLTANPILQCKVKLRSNRRHQVLSREQEAALCHSYYTTVKLGEIHWLQERFALLTGCRLGEQAHLQANHFQADILQIPDEGKTGRRLVPMCAEALEIAEFFLEFAGEVNSEWIFWPQRTNPDRNAMAENYVSKIFSPAAKAAGLHIQRRDLRRTFASRLIADGAPVFEVQKLLGHSNPTMTMIYCQVGLDQLRLTVAGLR
jgi:site-specific recombinase XerD